MGFCVDWSATLADADAAHTYGLTGLGFTFFPVNLQVFAIRLRKM